MVQKGMLIDITKCMGCKSCQVACKRFNELEPENLTTSPTDRSAKTWTLTRSVETEDADDKFTWRFWKNACFHCLDPTCVTVCPQDAISKTAEGAVVVDWDNCIGCKTCAKDKGLDPDGCPFDTPRYGVHGDGMAMMKCKMCIDRIQADLEPACATMCPTGAITFGDRDALLTEAKALVSATDSKYVDKVYGETENGGTSVLFISDVSFDKLGFPEVGSGETPTPTKLGPFQYKDNIAISGATVIIASGTIASYTATTNANGYAQFDEDIPAGDYTVTVENDGDTPINTPMNIASDGVVTYNGESAPPKSSESSPGGDGGEEDEVGLGQYTLPAAAAVIAGIVGVGAVIGLHKRKEKIRQEEEERRKREGAKAKKKKSGKKKSKKED